MGAINHHKELVVEIVRVLEEFHERHPDLFCDDIRVHSALYATRRKVLSDIEVTIVVQPFEGP